MKNNNNMNSNNNNNSIQPATTQINNINHSNSNNSNNNNQSTYSYKYLLVKNIISFYEKNNYQEAKNNLKKCFVIDTQSNQKESSIIINLCLLILFYKKNEIKKLFLCMEEINNRLSKKEFNINKLKENIQEEVYISLLIKNMILKETSVRKNSQLIGLKLDDISIGNNSFWLKDCLHFSIYCNLFLGVLLLQRSPTISTLHKNIYVTWLDMFKEMLEKCDCERCKSTQIKTVFAELEILRVQLVKSSSTIIINNDEVNSKLSSIYKNMNISNTLVSIDQQRNANNKSSSINYNAIRLSNNNNNNNNNNNSNSNNNNNINNHNLNKIQNNLYLNKADSSNMYSRTLNKNNSNNNIIGGINKSTKFSSINYDKDFSKSNNSNYYNNGNYKKERIVVSASKHSSKGNLNIEISRSSNLTNKLGLTKINSSIAYNNNNSSNINKSNNKSNNIAHPNSSYSQSKKILDEYTNFSNSFNKTAKITKVQSMNLNNNIGHNSNNSNGNVNTGGRSSFPPNVVQNSISNNTNTSDFNNKNNSSAVKYINKQSPNDGIKNSSISNSIPNNKNTVNINSSNSYKLDITNKLYSIFNKENNIINNFNENNTNNASNTNNITKSINNLSNYKKPLTNNTQNIHNNHNIISDINDNNISNNNNNISNSNNNTYTKHSSVFRTSARNKQYNEQHLDKQSINTNTFNLNSLHSNTSNTNKLISNAPNHHHLNSISSISISKNYEKNNNSKQGQLDLLASEPKYSNTFIINNTKNKSSIVSINSENKRSIDYTLQRSPKNNKSNTIKEMLNYNNSINNSYNYSNNSKNTTENKFKLDNSTNSNISNNTNNTITNTNNTNNNKNTIDINNGVSGNSCGNGINSTKAASIFEKVVNLRNRFTDLENEIELFKYSNIKIKELMESIN